MSQKFDVIVVPNASSVRILPDHSYEFQTADDVHWNASSASPATNPSRVRLASVPRRPSVNVLLRTITRLGKLGKNKLIEIYNCELSRVSDAAVILKCDEGHSW